MCVRVAHTIGPALIGDPPKRPGMANDDEHECGICGRTFDSEEELQEHAESEHADEM